MPETLKSERWRMDYWNAVDHTWHIGDFDYPEEEMAIRNMLQNPTLRPARLVKRTIEVVEEFE